MLFRSEHCHGQFNIYGSTYSEKDDPIDHVDLYIDRRKMEELGAAQVTKSGYYKFTLNHTITPILIEDTDANGNAITYPAGEEFELKEGVLYSLSYYTSTFPWFTKKLAAEASRSCCYSKHY